QANIFQKVYSLDFATQNRSGSKLPEGQNQRLSGRWKASLRATPHHCQACFIRSVVKGKCHSIRSPLTKSGNEIVFERAGTDRRSFG
ncbi:hypothetical protein, partial [Escherichia coli]|uniref:hypothetical protein n=1 Tax=Escherichia coli TaxID=562 RepID=UPI001CC02A3E